MRPGVFSKYAKDYNMFREPGKFFKEYIAPAAGAMGGSYLAKTPSGALPAGMLGMTLAQAAVNKTGPSEYLKEHGVDSALQFIGSALPTVLGITGEIANPVVGIGGILAAPFLRPVLESTVGAGAGKLGDWWNEQTEDKDLTGRGEYADQMGDRWKEIVGDIESNGMFSPRKNIWPGRKFKINTTGNVDIAPRRDIRIKLDQPW